MFKLTNEIIDQKLIGRNIKRLESYINSSTKINFQCLIDNFIWKTTPAHILDNRGCPKCAGKILLTNDIIDQRLLGRNIKRLDNYINNKISINFQCIDRKS